MLLSSQGVRDAGSHERGDVFIVASVKLLRTGTLSERQRERKRGFPKEVTISERNFSGLDGESLIKAAEEQTESKRRESEPVQPALSKSSAEKNMKLDKI